MENYLNSVTFEHESNLRVVTQSISNQTACFKSCTEIHIIGLKKGDLKQISAHIRNFTQEDQLST